MQSRATSIGAVGLPLCGSRSLASRSFVTLPKKQSHAHTLQSKRIVGASSAQEAEQDEGLTGEWPVNWSLASYEDVGEFFQNSLFKASASPGNSLKDIMNKELTYTFPDVSLDQVGGLFNKVWWQGSLFDFDNACRDAMHLTRFRHCMLIRMRTAPVLWMLHHGASGHQTCKVVINLGEYLSPFD